MPVPEERTLSPGWRLRLMLLPLVAATCQEPRSWEVGGSAWQPGGRGRPDVAQARPPALLYWVGVRYRADSLARRPQAPSTAVI